MQALSRTHARQEATDEPKKRAGAPIDPRWALRRLRDGWKLVAMAAAAGLAIGAIASMLVPRAYRSEAVLGTDVAIGPENPLAAQDALHEGALLLRDPSLLAVVRERTGSRGTLESLGRRIEVEADPEAAVLRVGAMSSSPEGARALTATTVSSFLDRRRESERERLLERGRTLRSELTAAERSLAQARVDYDRFRSQRGITDLEEEQERAIQEVARLNAQADEAAVSQVTSEARMRALQEAARNLPRMHTASASRTDTLQSQLAQARAELAAARSRYTAQHPAVVALEQRVSSLERARRTGEAGQTATTDATLAVNPVREELEGNAAIAAADHATAREEQAGLRRLAEQARERALALSEIEGQASLLLAAVRVGEQQVEAIRRGIAESESRAGDAPSGFRVISAAAVPEQALPSKGRTLAWMIPPILALLGAVGFILFQGRAGAKVVAATEVAWWGNAPVIGVTAWPRKADALDLLVSELEDMGAYAKGRTLVVPAREEDRDLAAEFAAKLAEAPWLAAGVLDVEEEKTVVSAIPVDVRVERGDIRPFRPTLPMTAAVVPASPPGGQGSRVRRASVRMMIDGEAARRALSEGVSMSDEDKPRRISGRFTLASPVALLDLESAKSTPHVTVDGVTVSRSISIGDAPTEPDLVARVIGANPLASSPSQTRTADSGRSEAAPVAMAPVRTVSVTGTLDRGDGRAPTGFVVQADAPKKEDAVLMLAMRILGDTDTAFDVEEVRAAVIEPSSTPTRTAPVLPNKKPLRAAIRKTPVPQVPALPALPPPENEQAVALAWNGALEGPTLRRAARLADRVLVLVREGEVSAADLAQMHIRLGRTDAIGYLVVSASEESEKGEDRLGDVREFWTSRRRMG